MSVTRYVSWDERRHPLTERQGRGSSILADLDLYVMEDLAEVWSDEHGGALLKSVFYVGWPEELDAGLRGGSAESVAHADTVEELLEHVADAEDALRAEFPEE